MATNGIDIAAERWLDEEAFRLQKIERLAGVESAGAAEKAQPQKRAAETRAPEDVRPADRAAARDAAHELALAPLVDKIAYGLARGLVVAMKELENHIASETRNVGDTVGRRLDTLQASFQDLTGAVSEQRATSMAVQEKCQQLAEATAALQESDLRQEAGLAALREETREFSTAVSTRIDVAKTALEQADTRQQAELAAVRDENRQRAEAVSQKIEAAAAALQEADARQASDLAALRNQTTELSAAVSERIDGLCKELGVQQEDLATVKNTLCGFSTRVDSVVERLDRQAEALRSMYSTYAQRETELEQLVDGLARLRAYPTPSATNRL